ncbi:hypothetical protein NBT05_11885 [Aquimarina sp. ERC-38]|uniref:hypothetical protein n=1 Tax=Aquimarina sp. ERC-38 TaxID=2949996 RepID=UPI0022451539|nr:hypothetical protein [Aquimarina sp. ERC-38]UZO79651.1 hypothetical protein NBT05_11885 [Aquimarina sp. ERC-38]
MIKTKDIFQNEKLRCGGFYELCIQVCPSLDMEPIKRYTDFIKSLENVDGPFNKNFEVTDIKIENFEHEWILNLDNYSIPFKTFHIHETESIETGFNWFDVCFYTSTIEEIFGAEYQTWNENPKYPTELTEFLRKTMFDLNGIYKFQMAMIDFEISGQYYLADLNTNFNNWTNSNFFVNEKDAHLISERNKTVVEIIADNGTQ